jgi:ectoine hydroxylase-related dioxygenase (phytanoyl-CoA dioxygenase family)
VEENIELQTKAAKAYMKEVWKMTLKQSVSSIFDKRSKEMEGFITTATDHVMKQVMDETKIEEIAKLVRQGAAYTAIQTMIQQTKDAALAEAKPTLDQATKWFSQVMIESLGDAIVELINEQLAKVQMF